MLWDLMNQILIEKLVVSQGFGLSKKLPTELQPSLSPCKTMGKWPRLPCATHMFTYNIKSREEISSKVVVNEQCRSQLSMNKCCS